MITEDTLIYDIETATLGSRPDPKTDKLRLFGAYSYKTKKHYYLTKLSDIKNIVKHHKYLVGFNNIAYDNQVLYHNGLHSDINKKDGYDDFTFKGKINIDLMTFFQKRAGGMKTKKGMLGDLLMSYSLDFITKTLDLVDEKDGKIKDFDYDVLKKEFWTSEEVAYIKEYLKRDLDVTKKLYEWVENELKGFIPYLNQNDIEKKLYITSTTASVVYKALCKALNLKEEYQNIDSEKYGGAYVAFPAGERFEGSIYCLDFNSLYPSVMHQCNLYSPVDFDGWNGGDRFKVLGMYAKENGAVEKLLKQWYEDRLEFKKTKDPREHALKIFLNTAYGILGNSSFKNFYNRTAADDCTRIARQWTMLARKIFKKNGYELIYTDTDSVYLLDPFNDKEKMLQVKDMVIKEIKDNVPVPYEHFDMGVDAEITHMFFFKNSEKNTIAEYDEKDFYLDDDDRKNYKLNLMKKNYIYITKEGKVSYLNLGVKKKSTSLLVRKIFREYLIPKILETKEVKFSKTYFENLINKLLSEDIGLISKRFQVKNVEEYKNKSQLQAQISLKYGGAGIYNLVKNKRFGVGKGLKYCSVEEMKQHNIQIRDLDLSGVWKELVYFIKEKKVVNLDGWI